MNSTRKVTISMGDELRSKGILPPKLNIGNLLFGTMRKKIMAFLIVLLISILGSIVYKFYSMSSIIDRQTIQIEKLIETNTRLLNTIERLEKSIVLNKDIKDIESNIVNDNLDIKDYKDIIDLDINNLFKKDNINSNLELNKSNYINNNDITDTNTVVIFERKLEITSKSQPEVQVTTNRARESSSERSARLIRELSNILDPKSLELKKKLKR